MPEEAGRAVRRLRDDFGADHVMLFVLRGPSSKDTIRSLERFAREVMPAFQEERVAPGGD